MKKPKIKKKPEPKSEIYKLTEVLEELEDATNCDALVEVYEKIERALRYAKEVHDEMLELRGIQIDHEALLKVVSVFLDAVRTFAAAGKAKE